MQENIIIESPQTPEPPSDSDDYINEYVKVESCKKEIIISKPLNVKKLGKEEIIKLLMEQANQSNKISQVNVNDNNNNFNMLYNILGSGLLVASTISFGILTGIL